MAYWSAGNNWGWSNSATIYTTNSWPNNGAYLTGQIVAPVAPKPVLSVPAAPTTEVERLRVSVDEICDLSEL